MRLAKERRKQEPDSIKKLEGEIKRLTRERDNLVAACAQGRAPVGAIHKREQGTAAIKDELAPSPHRLQTNGKELESLKAAIISRMGKFQDLMHADVALARQSGTGTGLHDPWRN
jgi:hypothetical protein